MATLYQRFKDLNLSLTRKELNKIGEEVAGNFMNPEVRKNSTRIKIKQIENWSDKETKTFDVWDYSYDFIPIIDSLLKMKPKRKRVSATKVNHNG